MTHHVHLKKLLLALFIVVVGGFIAFAVGSVRPRLPR